MCCALQPWCEDSNYDPDDLGKNQLTKFAEHLKDAEVRHDTLRGLITALRWRQAVLERTEGRTWPMRPAELPAFCDLLTVAAKRKRDKMHEGGCLAAVAKQAISDLQLYRVMALVLQSEWAIPLRLDMSIQASTASRVSDVAHIRLSNMAVTTLDGDGPVDADVLIFYSAKGKHLKAGSTEKHSVVQHKKVELCAVSAAGTARLRLLCMPQRPFSCGPALVLSEAWHPPCS